MDRDPPADVLVLGGTVYTPRQRLADGWVAIRGSRIAALGQGEPPDLPDGVRTIAALGLIVAPGFIDLHVHGGGGADVMDTTEEALRTVAQTHAAGGTTSWFGSTVTAPRQATMAAIQAAAGLVDQPMDGATLRGIHLEGPYLSPAQLGAHRLEYARLPDADEYGAFFAAMAGRGRLKAAPELAGALALGETARRHGVHVAMGHSNADLAVIRQALAAGYQHVTPPLLLLLGPAHRGRLQAAGHQRGGTPAG